MEKSCANYFLTATVIPIFKENNADEINRILSCLYQLYKNEFYDQLFFLNGTIPQHRYEDLMDIAFFEVWDSFCRRGANSTLSINADNYTAYFRTSLKKRLFTLIGREFKKIAKEKNIIDFSDVDNLILPGIDNSGHFSDKSKKIFKEIGENCIELLLLKYLKHLSYEEIANLKHIKPKTAKHTVWRCKQMFIEKWENDNNNFN